jgi:hypothetical protein
VLRPVGRAVGPCLKARPAQSLPQAAATETQDRLRLARLPDAAQRRSLGCRLRAPAEPERGAQVNPVRLMAGQPLGTMVWFGMVSTIGGSLIWFNGRPVTKTEGWCPGTPNGKAGCPDCNRHRERGADSHSGVDGAEPFQARVHCPGRGTARRAWGHVSRQRALRRRAASQGNGRGPSVPPPETDGSTLPRVGRVYPA